MEEVMHFKEMALLNLRHRGACDYGANFVIERVSKGRGG